MFPFPSLKIEDNEEGWGPSGAPEKFKDVTYYTPFNKGDKLGKAADWQQVHQGKFGRFQQKEKEGAVNTIFNFYYQDEDSSFQLVDNTKVQPKKFTRGGRFPNRPFQAARTQGQQKPRSQKFNRLGSTNQWNRSRFQETATKKKEFSVEVKPEWKLVEEIEYNKLSKLTFDEPAPADLLTCGKVGYYNTGFDLVSSKNEKPIDKTNKVFSNVTTSDDPIIRKLSMENQGTVFATDAILAHLMTCTRSVNPWDIVVTKAGSKLFFDKRDNSSFDFVTVNETAVDPPSEEPKESINSSRNLGKEATTIIQNFGQQVLVKGDSLPLSQPNPFSEGDDHALIGYKYRKWTLEENTIIARCDIDAIVKGKKDGQLSIKALNEFEPKVGSEWRKKIETQRGAVLATELRNNAHKLAKWTSQSIIGGADSIKLGYITRSSPKDATSHVLLATQDYKPREFANQINLNPKNMWGVLRTIIDLCMKQQTGKYVILKEPGKNAIKLYAVPQDAFDPPAPEKEKIES